MTCHHPITINSKVGLSLAKQVPCGRCSACRVNRAEMWVLRLTHELEEWGSDALFLTLTYEKMPLRGSLEKKEFVKFLKRLRKDLSAGSRPGEGRRIKYYACGEYGGNFERPHYHVILFGLGKRDCTWSRALGKFRCTVVEEAWGKGLVDVGSVTSASMRYVANYIGKSYLGDSAKIYNDREPPFSLMSKGMGLKWAIRNEKQLREIGIRKSGQNVRIPRYYVSKLGLESDLSFASERTELHMDRLKASGVLEPSYKEVVCSIEDSRKQAVANESGRDSVRKKKEEVF